jgi:hypothetical protein
MMDRGMRRVNPGTTNGRRTGMIGVRGGRQIRLAAENLTSAGL